jgi:predicted nucleotidyltransferase component of viral defense system
MADTKKNQAASVKQRLLNLARKEGRVYDVVLVRYALERALYRLSISDHRDRFVLKGGMLVTLWLDDGNRETRDADFLGSGDSEHDRLKTTFAEILGIQIDDGLDFDIDGLTATAIREDMEYGGVRLRTTAHLERTRVPITIDIAFGDALPEVQALEYPSLLGMETPQIRTYPPEIVIAEKFQAMVALGVANGRMKDYYDLWAIPRSIEIEDEKLDTAIRATFERRKTAVPLDRPPGLSAEFVKDDAKRRQWQAYIRSIDINDLSLNTVVEAVWALVEPTCVRLNRLK